LRRKKFERGRRIVSFASAVLQGKSSLKSKRQLRTKGIEGAPQRKWGTIFKEKEKMKARQKEKTHLSDQEKSNVQL